MNISWSDIKEVFFAIGSIAGVLALARPVFESKLQRDIERIQHIKSLINEQALVDLEAAVYQARRVPDDQFQPFSQLAYERRTNQDMIRFTGPLAKHLAKELDGLIAAYYGLREYIQVNEWEPRSHIDTDGTKYITWDFNKQAFTNEDGIPQGYAKHLDAAAEKAAEMKCAYQRFQIVSELHLFEAPFASWLLKRRFNAHHLKCTRPA